MNHNLPEGTTTDDLDQDMSVLRHCQCIYCGRRVELGDDVCARCQRREDDSGEVLYEPRERY